MKKAKIATGITMIVMVAYVILLAVMTSNGKIMTSDVLSLKGLMINWETHLPFTVSIWWSLLVFPMFISFLFKAYNLETFVGKELNGTTKNGVNWNARHTVFMLMRLMEGLFLIVIFLSSLAFIFSAGQGDLSLLSNVICSYVICAIIYLILLVGMGIVQILCDYDDNDIFKDYVFLLVAYKKQGVKGAACQVGLTIGLLTFLIFKFFSKLSNGIKNSFTRTEPDWS
ncbi:MAG: hypothetical protein ACOYMB_00545 [Patescibacteria group bacterium]